MSESGKQLSLEPTEKVYRPLVQRLARTAGQQQELVAAGQLLLTWQPQPQRELPKGQGKTGGHWWALYWHEPSAHLAGKSQTQQSVSDS